MTYCVDTDLLIYRNDILSHGVSSWEDQRKEAYAMINRIVSIKWYRAASAEMGYDYKWTAFNPDLVMNDNLKRLEVFKTLELAYMLLKKDGPEVDGFERNESSFRDRYNEELDLVFADGIDYDWDGNDIQDDDEYKIRVKRRLVRS